MGDTQQIIKAHRISNMEELARIAIFGAEGNMEETPRQVASKDRTVTYGYGYTFIRRGRKEWERYKYLDDDLATIGIKLTDTEKDQLDAIADARNESEKPECKKDKTKLAKKLAEIDDLISEFEGDWKKNRKDLTEPEARMLLSRQLAHDSNDINRQFRSYLGKNNGDALSSHLQNTREMVGLHDLTYSGGPGKITKELTKALWNGDRARAASHIDHKLNNVQKKYRNGIAKRRYMQGNFIGYYYDPANPTKEEIQNVLKLQKERGKYIAEYEKLYGRQIARANEEFGELFDTAKLDEVQPFRESINIANIAKDGKLAKAEIPDKAPDMPELPALNPVPSAKGPLQPEGDILSKIGEMGQSMHDSDVDAAKAQAQIPEILGILLDKMFMPANSDASELSPLKTDHQQTMNQPMEHTNGYHTVSASELREIAFEGLAAIDERKNEMREWYSKNKGEPLAESMIEVAAAFSHLTDGEQKTSINNAVLTKEREDLNKEIQQRNEIAEAYGYNRFYARIPNFLKNRHQIDYDQWGRELEQKDSALSKREMENSPEMEKVLAKVNTPEFQEKKAQTLSEFKTSEAERLKDLAALDKEWDSFAGQKFCINRLIEKLPAKIGDMGIVVKGDPTDIDNLFSQSKQIGAQTEPAIQMTRQYERGMERS
jgi:GH24 family phage-related lysozyme (muramidase)